MGFFCNVNTIGKFIHNIFFFDTNVKIINYKETDLANPVGQKIFVIDIKKYTIYRHRKNTLYLNYRPKLFNSLNYDHEIKSNFMITILLSESKIVHGAINVFYYYSQPNLFTWCSGSCLWMKLIRERLTLINIILLVIKKVTKLQ